MKNNYIKAYKFRSSAQMAFVFDLIINQRLFCAEYDKLNDPLEASSVYSYNSDTKQSIVDGRMKNIEKIKNKYRICSLSGTIDLHLLWAHYAGGFDGVAIEIELPKDNPHIRKVDYRGIFDSIDIQSKEQDSELAKKCLLSKYKEWEYEQEIRILNENEWFKLERPVKSVIIGSRVNGALTKVLNIICTDLKINLSRIIITDDGLMPFSI